MAAAHFAEVVAEFRHDGQVPPLFDQGLIMVPEEEAVPGLETEAEAQARVATQGELDREVHGTRGIVGQVVADGEHGRRVVRAVHERRFLLGNDAGGTSGAALRAEELRQDFFNPGRRDLLRKSIQGNDCAEKA